MKNNKSFFHPIKLVGALVFLMAFILNIQTNLNGDWELVNMGFAQSTTTEGCYEVTQPGGATVWVCDGTTLIYSTTVDFGACSGPWTNCRKYLPN
ncbi:hypothetical protein [Algoriphagus persicinus]|uniref:hypothetical protein n=1 Tax=Algoriphagus persicinus TaxID=3108754 RepID=UPI002B3D5A2C|nr:hypothetical protein [Algoriphagus sp. E1-3-M2]MEB2785528.1 hypothetical protein [Algoriphagus sp. E1-3-M2]